jgi:hypothetical protein
VVECLGGIIGLAGSCRAARAVLLWTRAGTGLDPFGYRFRIA